MDRESIGPYRLIRLLGKGGMGAVYEALHEAIERRAAIKILHPEFASNREYAERFLNEARAANRIRHANIVEVYDLGTLSDGTTYLVMEYLDGETLGKRQQRHGGRLPVAEVVWIGREIASAVHGAHQQGIVHRDLKPDNVMLVAGGHGERVKLLDFGIAKLIARPAASTAATQVGTVMGTLLYIPPEQLRDTAQVTTSADVYALGALLYHLVAGRPPFAAKNDVDLMAMHLRDEAPALTTLAPEASARFAELIHRMLAKDPLLRPQMIEVERQLAALQSEEAHAPQPGSAEDAPQRAVPKTLVRKTGPAAAPSRATPDGTGEATEANELSPKGSTSTISGSASESRLAVPGSTHRPRGAYLATLGGAAALVVAVAIWSRHPRPVPPGPAAVPRTEPVPAAPAPNTTSATGGTAAPPSTVVPTGSAVPGFPVGQGREGPPPPVAQPRPERPAPASEQTGTTPATLDLQPQKRQPVVRTCPHLPITASCITNSPGKLTPQMVDAAIKAARVAEVKLCTGQRLRAFREGSKMLFEPSHLVPADHARLFSDTLRGLLPAGSGLPWEIIFRCGK